jgi:predicted alpha/beta-fold hydrolase
VPPSIDSLDLPPFKPRFPWWGPDLQTIAVLLTGARARDLAPHTSERMAFPMADRTGDILLGMLDRPAEPAEGRPLVLLIHGLTGSEDSSYMLNAARHLLDSGYSVLRLNMRGSGPSRLYCREHYHLGRTADFRRVLSQLPDELTGRGIVAVGYSLGGAMLLKYLGEEGAFSPLLGAATICAPIDLLRTCRHMSRTRNWLYQAYLLNDMKAEALAPGALTSPEEQKIIRAARTVREYDDRFISPRYGFRGAEDYYELCSPLAFMPEIRVPTMVIASCDDPWIPVEYYREFNWADNPSLVPLMPPAGGHIGFHAHDSTRPWCDLAVEKFIDRLANMEA